MNEFNLDLTGWEELKGQFQDAISNYSDICADVIDKKANEFKKDLTKNMNDVVTKHTGNLRKGFKFDKVEFTGSSIKKNIRATASHYHLVEKGHYKVKAGKRVGWVEGKFFFKKTVENFSMVDGMQEVCNRIIKECEK